MVSPVGNTVAGSWANILAGKSGIGPIAAFDVSNFSTRIAGSVKNLNVTDYLPLKEVRKMDPFMQYGVVAGIQAFEDAGITITEANAERMGVVIGAGIGGLLGIEMGYGNYLQGGPKRISPFYIPSNIINLIAGHLSIRYGLKGPNYAIVTACSTGTHCIGDAARMIERGDADMMLAGG
ncbi:MAG TPA: beta-ketoacyl synthase N-terminal-like domain-containing protein, partial [Gammaproteobacteria bacterium]|nr:beta-ketoacyl synthase N-terminal-like domain-containing protein [Gammaproteobacteria bacterium]